MLLRLLLLRLDHLATVVRPTVWADAVGRFRGPALGALRAPGSPQRVVGAALVLLHARGLALRNCHQPSPSVLVPRSPRRIAKGELGLTSSQPQLSTLRSTPQRGQSPRQSSRQSGCTGTASVTHSKKNAPRSISRPRNHPVSSSSTRHSPSRTRAAAAWGSAGTRSPAGSRIRRNDSRRG